MFQRILVPLDGSSRAERAIPVALRLAHASGGSLVFLRAVSVATEFWPFLPGQQSLASTAIDSVLSEAQGYLAHVRTAFHEQDVAIETIMQVGPAASTILQIASDKHVDLVVICSHGHTGLTRQIMGSVAERVARHAPVPVLLLREGGPIPTGLHPDAARPLRILVPLDGSNQAEAALAPAITLVAGLAVPAMGALHVTRVVKPISARPEREEAVMEHTRTVQQAKDYLQKMVEHLREGWSTSEMARLMMTWSIAIDTHIADGILRVAETGEEAEGISPPGGCEMIAMATHGYSGVSLLTMGSVTEHVLNATKLPVLIVRPGRPADQKPAAAMKTTFA
jgi:nucleotide-binding universal stress UspA family protein